MKTKKFVFTHTSAFIIFLIGAFLFGCMPSGGISVHNDVVYATKRMELCLSGNDKTKNTPLLSLVQTFIKEKSSNNEFAVKVYDVATLKSPGFRLEEKAYLIADEKVHKMNLSRVENDFARSVSTSTENIMKADSTSVTVVTGQTEHNRQITKFNYELSEAAIRDIKAAKQVSFRYYAGPSMITVTLTSGNLRRLKRLLVL